MSTTPDTTSHRTSPWLLVVILSCLFATTNTLAATSPESIISPESIEGTTKVDAEAFIGLFDEIPNLIIIDSRIPGDRKQGYIEGSISLPDVDTTCETLSKAIAKKDAPSLFYCNGVKCGRSAKAINIALGCGYSNIYWFRGGFEEWLEKGYPYLQQ